MKKMIKLNAECIGCQRFPITRLVKPCPLCGFGDHVTSCPCIECIVKICCSKMCEVRILALDKLVSKSFQPLKKGNKHESR